MVGMGRVKRSWVLAKTTWDVLRSEKQLVGYPVLSFLASMVVLVVLGVLGWFTSGSETGTNGNEIYTASVATYLVGIATYLGLAFVQIYFLAALCASANERLQGRETSLGQGISIANSRLARILGWAVVTATVSVILRAIEERLDFLGQIIVGALGVAWRVVTFLTVPIIVFEDVGPVTALKRSGTLFKKTWGENLIAHMSLALVGILATLPAILVIVLGVVSLTAVVAVPVIAIGVLWIIGVSTVMSALSGIYRTALYRYAVDGQIQGAFSSLDLEHAFGQRKSR